MTTQKSLYITDVEIGREYFRETGPAEEIEQKAQALRERGKDAWTKPFLAAPAIPAGQRADVEALAHCVKVIRDYMDEQGAFGWDVNEDILLDMQGAIDKAERHLTAQPNRREWCYDEPADMTQPNRGDGGMEAKAKIVPGLLVCERDWTEDFPGENGNYLNTCVTCKLAFTGHKRRHICKTCAVPPLSDVRAATDGERLEIVQELMRQGAGPDYDDNGFFFATVKGQRVTGTSLAQCADAAMAARGRNGEGAK